MVLRISLTRLSGDDITKWTSNKLLALLSLIDGKTHKLIALTKHQLKLIAQIVSRSGVTLIGLSRYYLFDYTLYLYFIDYLNTCYTYFAFVRMRNFGYKISRIYTSSRTFYNAFLVAPNFGVTTRTKTIWEQRRWKNRCHVACGRREQDVACFSS